MKKIWNWFLYLFLLAGFPLLIWAGLYSAKDTYIFWKYGIEKNSEIIALDHTSRSGRSGTTYYYELQIDENRLIEGFSYSLPVGKSVPVLTLPENPEKISLGKQDSSLFEIFSYSIGGQFRALLVLGTYLFMAIYGPSTLVTILRDRNKFINQ
ncbi:ABC transporter permease [Microbulbifer sp. YPW1]|uniref:ABC transporter permease n=1 Tax=Microbulbifer sp. YPW1 TaxID=2745199 RepID=UPI0015998007|nr:ABC transporter permease [Microbulbifer sp. YPW1]QKX16503.1 ABC transporter permease [Microbulbifer sp. YPW1]QKX17649.1 ABC transporter permease [Microbulbifer sp. YPW1]